jgi:hypothetical protein
VPAKKALDLRTRRGDENPSMRLLGTSLGAVQGLGVGVCRRDGVPSLLCTVPHLFFAHATAIKKNKISTNLACAFACLLHPGDVFFLRNFKAQVCPNTIIFKYALRYDFTCCKRFGREPLYMWLILRCFRGYGGAAAKTTKLVRTLPYTDENDCLDASFAETRERKSR